MKVWVLHERLSQTKTKIRRSKHQFLKLHVQSHLSSERLNLSCQSNSVDPIIALTFFLLCEFYYAFATFIHWYSMALAFTTYWSLHCKLGFTFSALFNGFSGPSCRKHCYKLSGLSDIFHHYGPHILTSFISEKPLRCRWYCQVLL